MNKKFKITLVAVAATLFGCGSIYALNQKGTNEQLVDRVVWNLPFTFNYAKATSAGDADNLNLLSATPLAYDKNNKIVNYAAKTIVTSKDGKKLTITLKDGLKYQNNEKVTAQDYKTSAQILANAKTKGNFNWVSDNIVGGQAYYDNKAKHISGIKVLSEKVYEINLIQPSSYFKTLLTNPAWAPVQQKQLNKYGLEKFGSEFNQVLSSGEYKVKKFAKNQYIEYELNNTSLVTKSLPKTIKFKEFADKEKSSDEFKKGKINSINKSLTIDKLLNKKQSDKPQIAGGDSGMSFLINNNLDKKTFKAMYLALDLNYMKNKFYYGLKKVNTNFMPNLTNNATNSKNTFDFNQAKKLVQKNTSVIFQIKSDGGASYDQIVKYIVNQWTKLGIKVNTKPVPFGPNQGIYLPHNQKRNFDVTLTTFGLDYYHQNSLYTTFDTLFNWKDENLYKQYQKLLNDAKISIDEKTQKRYYKEIENNIKQTGQIYPMFQDQTNVYVQNKGWEIISFGQLLKPVFWNKLN